MIIVRNKSVIYMYRYSSFTQNKATIMLSMDTEINIKIYTFSHVITDLGREKTFLIIRYNI